METLITFKIGDELVGVDIGKVREVTEIAKPMTVPRAPAFLLGLVNVRGEVVPVISLKKRLGLAGEEISDFLLVIEDNGRVAGLKVDELMGTRRIDEKKINRSSELLSTRKEKDFFLGVYETEGKPILILNLTKTLAKEDT